MEGRPGRRARTSSSCPTRTRPPGRVRVGQDEDVRARRPGRPSIRPLLGGGFRRQGLKRFAGFYWFRMYSGRFLPSERSAFVASESRPPLVRTEERRLDGEAQVPGQILEAGPPPRGRAL